MGTIELKTWQEILETDTITVHYNGAEITKAQGGFRLSEHESDPAITLATPEAMDAELIRRGLTLNEWW